MPLKLLAAAILASICSSSGQFAQYPGQAQGFNMASYMPQMPAPSPRLPMVMMPRHSKSLDEKRKRIRRGKKKKSRRHHHLPKPHSDESAAKYFAYRSKKRREVLTPVLSYVNKNGYVLYQKRLGKNPQLTGRGEARGPGGEVKRGGARGGRDYDSGYSGDDYDESELDYDDIPEDGDDF